jgi:hypothetical protein
MKRKLPYRCLWQAELLNRKVRKDAVPIDISLFKKIKGSIGLLGYRRIIKEGQEHIRIYRKDTYGTTYMIVNLEQSSVETRTETWTGFTGVCSEFGLIPYRRA